MPDLTAAFDSPEIESAFLAIVDREGKIPAALEDLGPVCDRDVVLLDSGHGFRERELAALGARVTAVNFDDGADEAAALAALAEMPEGCADTVVAMWSELALPGSAFIAAADRLLRARGKLLLVHDYGRDDVWSLWPERRDRVVEWSLRKGVFLGDEFRVRVIHSRWTFEAMEQASELLTAGFGDRGAALAGEIKRPKLEYQVAVYHRWAPAARASLRYEDDPQAG
jgi:hypothetical protein